MKWYRKILKNPGGIKIVGFLGASYLKFVFKTTRWDKQGYHHITALWARDAPFIMAFWHNRLLMAPQIWQHSTPCHMLISAHSDGQLISEAVTYFSVKTVAGSSTRGGSYALKTLIKKLKNGLPVGVTPDGPKGPIYSVSPGTVALARIANVPIVPVCCSIRRRLVINSWDRFIVPLPFSKGIIDVGAPIDPATQEEYGNRNAETDKRASDAALRRQLTATMHAQADHIDRALGLEVPRTTQHEGNAQ